MSLYKKGSCGRTVQFRSVPFIYVIQLNKGFGCESINDDVIVSLPSLSKEGY